MAREQEYVICPHCGAGYGTDKIMLSIMAKSPFVVDQDHWLTRVICTLCRKEFPVSGSRDQVFGQPRPRQQTVLPTLPITPSLTPSQRAELPLICSKVGQRVRVRGKNHLRAQPREKDFTILRTLKEGDEVEILDVQVDPQDDSYVFYKVRTKKGILGGSKEGYVSIAACWTEAEREEYKSYYMRILAKRREKSTT